MMKKYKRLCPRCSKEIFHSTEEYCESMERKKTLCKSCGCRNPNRLKRMSEINSGEKNPFFGKKHTDATKSKIANRDYSVNKTKAFRDKISLTSRGSSNPMYRRSVYSVWVEKYGREEADRRLSELNKKRSDQMSGSKNNMYGKPSPQGSGNGWSGWYKGWFFRSLRELSYVITVLEKNRSTWRSAESKDLRMKYIMDGRSRTYFADFLVDGSILVEVKPKKLMGSRQNLAKRKTASRFCKERGFSYRMVDVRILDEDVIADLHSRGVIRFTKRYEMKMRDRLMKRENKV
jgi:hypothetical protein